MNIAVLGASGIGKFHAKYFSRFGEIKAILGSSKETAEKTALMLQEFNINPQPYHSVENLFNSEQIDIAVICLPTRLHEEYIKKSLEKGLHVFCEKPLLSGNNIYGRAENLFKLAEKNNVHLSCNLQWAHFPSYVSYPSVHSFEVSMQPGTKGLDMIVDQVCHGISVLQKLVPNGEITNISINKKSPDGNNLSFTYASCNVVFDFTYKQNQPRRLAFKINRDLYVRELTENYDQSFIMGEQTFQITDPLLVSIQKFVQSLDGKEPLLTKDEILHNIYVQKMLVKAYEEHN